MRRIQNVTLFYTVLMAGVLADVATAQPGHAPFTFAPFEIENYERTLAPNGVLGATVVFDAIVPGYHPAAVAAGQPSVPYKTGAPVYLEDAASTYEQFGGILGHVSGGTVTQANYENIFAGGTQISPAHIPNGGETRNFPTATASYNGTKISLVTRTDANTADDVAITSGNQALRVSMVNNSQGDGDTSFDRPASLIIKATDFWGIADSRFDTFETVRSDPSQYSVAIDVTYLANEIPDTFSTQLTQPYFRLGFISNHAGIFDESPTNVLQGPPSLVFGNVDTDGDMLPNFTDPDYVDPDNPDFLPGNGVPGVIQRRYVFPASAMDWPVAPLAGVADPADGGRRVQSGGLANAYSIGFVFNGNWQLGTSASFIVDNFRFLPRNPVDHADFNDDNVLNALDWQVLIANLNSQTAKMFAQGDIGSHPEEAAVSPGVVDFQDFVRFEEIWDANQGAGAFQTFLAGLHVPEPSSMVMCALGAAVLTLCRRRRGRRIAMLIVASAAIGSSTASAQLSNTLLFGFEPPPEPNLQRWVPAGDAANTDMPPVLTTAAMGATQGSTRGLSITQNGSGFSWDAAVSIFGGEEGLPTQQMAFNNALDVGANHFVLEMDVVYKDALIPDTGFVNLAVRFSAGSTSTDEVHSLAAVGDGSGPVPDQVIPVSIPLSIDPVNTSDGVLSVPASAATAGFYNLTLGFNGDWGPAPATFFVDNVRLRQVTQPALLTLEINAATGAAMLKNVAGPNSGAGPVVFDYYEIMSAEQANAADYNDNSQVDAADYVAWRKTLNQMVPAGTGADGNDDGMITQADYALWRANFGGASADPSLNPAGWNSLDGQNIDAVDGGDAGTIAGDSVLEGWDKSGSPNAAALSEAFLNGASTWDSNESRPLGAIFTPGGSRNLVLRFREPNRPGFLRTGLVTYVGGGAGSGLANANSVPEPRAIILALIPTAVALAARRAGRANGIYV